MSEVRSRTVVHYKERGRADAAQYLGAITQAAVSRLIEQGHVSGQVVLVPAPSKRSSARARGGDHMARALAHCSFPYVQALYHSEQALESVGLSAQARRQNMQQAVRLAPEAALLRGREVLLVDDVITTGATLIAAASALSSAGAKVAGGLGWISA
ncbi:phosphoribosyltransferase family protein [Corynebacterium sp. 153RC1]|uniref:ComF family protein n=1 Tax=unclassified Corynebacterium TaxID=2624378 RepID=UPI00211B8217|nr:MULTISPECIES: phosphoribosyltransferase family protein [unclassified Corynebacterium]MCQ9370039.1 phosphoribosyltransferase family protein [Corynebacterium sp. 35RC1]MCQ9352119.1 phosphoribosyltransferase family protein [Corynebacterium sp. 209RC1]MCQ9354121.1 phosphoribosyltransferase family protein [Corynebacterium sp. 1222RC1]MCQ9356401.1 phosphoribosyltransferase family protein [Corynebacterium sp. 122RC1]MCQ9358503.1 phosphoribosyltransferase family protein [Corynebacterium sp. 142RC1]